jgi:hypothetical protein
MAAQADVDPWFADRLAAVQAAAREVQERLMASRPMITLDTERIR